MTAPEAPDDAARVAAIRQGLSLYHAPEEFFELRFLDVKNDKWKPKTIAGYFDDLDLAASVVAKFDGRGQCYVTLNPVDPAVATRYYKRVEENPKITTGDKEIAHRRRLLIDLDAKRPSGISADEAQHEAAKAKARVIFQALRDDDGWDDPLAVIDSGNGVHILYALDLPNDDAARDTVKHTLEKLDRRFSDDVVKVDLTVFNAARIVKIPGTLAMKGDPTPERPHRRSRILWQPEGS